MSESYSRSEALRMFAGELALATKTLTFSDDDRAPKYQLLPSGGRANRVFISGTVTEIEDVGNGGSEYWKARVVDPNGDTFFVYAGQYQPEAADALRSMETPAYVSVVGKTDTYEGEDGTTYVSLSGEWVAEVDEATRDRWVVEAAEQTLDRLQAGLDGEDAPALDEDIDVDLFEMALEEYEQDDIEAVRQKATAAVATLDDDVQVEAESAEPAGATAD